MLKNYRALTKLRKQQFDMAEQAMMSINAKINQFLIRKEAMRKEAREISLPSDGTGKNISTLMAKKAFISENMQVLEKEIDTAVKRKEQLKKALKTAHMEYEQAKSIKSQLLEKSIRKRKREEQGQLDEIGTQHFWRNREASR